MDNRPSAAFCAVFAICDPDITDLDDNKQPLWVPGKEYGASSVDSVCDVSAHHDWVFGIHIVSSQLILWYF